MFIALFLTLCSCLVEKVELGKNFKVSTFFTSEANTVHLIQTELRELLESNTLSKIGDDEVTTSLSIFLIEENETRLLRMHDKKSKEQNNFFFTSPVRGEYMATLKVVQNESNNRPLGIEYKVFSGAANKPSIVSNNDVEVFKAENVIEKVTELVRKNTTIQEIDEEKENEYKQIFESIVQKVIFLAFLKIISTSYTLYFTNKKTQSFYTSQGLAVNDNK